MSNWLPISAMGWPTATRTVLKEIYDQCSALVYTIALRSVGNQDDAADITNPSLSPHGVGGRTSIRRRAPFRRG